MTFQVNAGDSIQIRDQQYLLAEHPAFSGMPYGQEGRQGYVYKLIPASGNGEAKALKVFKPQFRSPSLVYSSELLQNRANIEGLAVCRREVIVPQTDLALLTEHKDLLYAVVMPWISGPSWYDIVSNGTMIDRDVALQLARSLAGVLSNMEQKGLAHCDLSGANIIIPGLAEDGQQEHFFIELVDVEQMHGPQFDRPEYVPAGSPGYASRSISSEPIWNKYTDRFAGGILICEMLAWSSENIRQSAWGESYFDPDEMQEDCERAQVMRSTLEREWGHSIASLFTRVWNSQDAVQCPTFSDWLLALMSCDAFIETDAAEEPPQADMEQAEAGAEQAAEPVGESKGASIRSSVLAELETARRLGDQGEIDAALDILESLKLQLDDRDELLLEVNLYMEELQNSRRSDPVDDGPNLQAVPAMPPKSSLKKRIALFSVAAVLLLVCGTIVWYLSANMAKDEQHADLRPSENRNVEQASDEGDKDESLLAVAEPENSSEADEEPVNEDDAADQPVAEASSPAEHDGGTDPAPDDRDSAQDAVEPEDTDQGEEPEQPETASPSTSGGADPSTPGNASSPASGSTSPPKSGTTSPPKQNPSPPKPNPAPTPTPSPNNNTVSEETKAKIVQLEARIIELDNDPSSTIAQISQLCKELIKIDPDNKLARDTAKKYGVVI